MMLIAILGIMLCGTQPRSWFDSVFDAMQRSELHSYRIVTVITPEYIDDPLFFQELHKFAKHCEHTLHTADIKMQVECWVDPRCSEESVQKFQKHMGDFRVLHYIPLSRVLKRMTTLGLPSVLTAHPSSELTLNWIKLWSLDLPFDLNVYLDPSLWKEYGKYSSIIQSSSAFGVTSYQDHKDAFFIHCIFPPTEKDDLKIMSINNQFLLGSNRAHTLSIIKAIAQKRFMRYELDIQAVLARPLHLYEALTVEAYQTELTQRIEALKAYPERPLSDAKWIDVLSGSLFLQEMAEHLCLAKFYSTIGRQESLSIEERWTKKFINYQDLQAQHPNNLAMRNQTARNLLMENDLHYFQNNLTHPNRAMIASCMQEEETDMGPPVS